MGHFSTLAIDIAPIEREPSRRTRVEVLQYFLEDLYAELEVLDGCRPYDLMDSCFDRYFYTDYIVRYFENPWTIQDILCGIEEVAELIRAEVGETTICEIRQIPGQCMIRELFGEQVRAKLYAA